jgi:hypothetical protein
MKALLLMLFLCTSFQDPISKGLTVGKRFPDFLLPNVEGGFGRLSDYRGKKVLVINFASW